MRPAEWPRFHASFGLGVRWPWGFGWDPMHNRSDEWGSIRSYYLDLGLLTFYLTLIVNPARWYK